MADIMYRTISNYWHRNLQIVVIANGPFQEHFRNIANFHNLHSRIAVIDFDEQLSRSGYAASDFLLIPSLFEPCGLPQMIGSIYGSLPIAHDTGGLHDTVVDVNVGKKRGNGFVFKTFDSAGLSWAIDQAMSFYDLAPEIKIPQITRIMKDSLERFNHSVTAKQYFRLYENMLHRPLIKR